MLHVLKENETRKCNGCTVCCDVLNVTDKESGFYKKGGEKCPHLGETGCTIYETKPSVCTGYLCMWAVNLGNWFKDVHRPDRCGILATMNNIDSTFTQTTGLPTITLYEVVPGAFTSYWGANLINKIAKKFICILKTDANRNSGRTTMIGPIKSLRSVEMFEKARKLNGEMY
jgi:hypothetical protein